MRRSSMPMETWSLPSSADAFLKEKWHTRSVNAPDLDLANAQVSAPRGVSWLLRQSTPTHLGLILLICLVKYGAGVYPSSDRMMALSSNLTNPHASPILQPPDDFRLASPVSAIAAGVLHLSGARAYLGFHFLLALAALCVPYAMVKVRKAPALRATVTLLLIGSAIPAVLLNWVGGYDAVTIGAAAVAVLAEMPAISALGWMVLAINNLPIALLSLLVIGGYKLVVEGRGAVVHLAAAVGGVTVGGLGITALLHHWGVVTTRLSVFTDVYSSSRFINGLLDFVPIILVTAFGVGWIFLSAPEIRSLRGTWILLGSGVAASILVPLIAVDQSRVVASVLYPVLLVAAVRIHSLLDAATLHRVLDRCLPAALLFVMPLAWDGQLVYAGWRHLANLLAFLVHGGPLPT